MRTKIETTLEVTELKIRFDKGQLTEISSTVALHPLNRYQKAPESYYVRSMGAIPIHVTKAIYEILDEYLCTLVVQSQTSERVEPPE